MEPCWTSADVDICEDCCTTSFDTLPLEQAEIISNWAAWYLWNATGRQYGLCEKTYRPCRRECGGGYRTPLGPVKIDGEWFNMTCGQCSGSCGCDFVSEVRLANVHEVLAITEDGTALPPATTVVVYDRARLIRIDGAQWPSCQNLSTPTGEPGSWSVTVLEGKPIPPGGAYVAGLLACELAKACTGDAACALPKRLQTITRQGVSAAFQDRFEDLSDLRTGIWEIDAWIESARSVLFRQPSISSPDVPKPSVQTWPVLA